MEKKLGSDPDIPIRGPFTKEKLGSDPDIPNRRYCKLGPSRIISGFKAGNTYIEGKLGSDPIISYILIPEAKSIPRKTGVRPRYSYGY
jgi:hypothetical protein